MSSQVEDYTKNVLKVVVAQVCQIIGWNSINQSSLEVLVDTLDRFMKELTKQTYRITELYQRTEPTLDDLALAFHYLNLNLTDIKEYIEYVGPPENVPRAIPQYPAAPPMILNVKRSASEDAAAEPSTSELVQPKAEDSEDDEQFLGFFQYNREYKTEITGAAEESSASVEVKKEENGVAGDVKPSTTADDPRTGVDTKQDVLKKAAAAGRVPTKRKHTTVQLTPGGRIQGIREGRLPGADIPSIFLSEIEAAQNLEQQGPNYPNEHKSSKSKSHKHHHQESNGGGSSRSGTPSFPAAAPASSSSSKRDKLSQEPDRVKSNIFKKISQPHKHSPQQQFTTATPINPPSEVIDIDSSPNPPPVHSPAPHQQALPQQSSAKREKKEKKKKEKVHREHQNVPLMLPEAEPSLLNLPQLPAGTTLEAIPMQHEPSNRGVAANSPFQPTSAFFPNFPLPQGPNLNPFGGLPPTIGIPSALAALAKVPPGQNSPKRKEKEAKKLQQKLQSAAPASLMPSNLFLPDTTVRVETVVKAEPVPPVVQGEGVLSQMVKQLSQLVPPPVDNSATIDLLSDEDAGAGVATAAVDGKSTVDDVAAAAAAEKAAAKKAEKQRKKEQRRLEKLAAAAADKPMNLSADGGGGGDEVVVVKKEKQSKMERKMEKMLLKKMLKSKKAGEEGGPEQPIDLSTLDQEKKRKLEKKLKKLEKSNKAKLKAEAAEQAVIAEGVVPPPRSEALPAGLPKSPEPLLLPKLTLKLNSPKVGDMLHSPKEAVASVHSSKDYRPLTVDTGEAMTPVKRVKTGSAHNSPLGSLRQDTAAPPVEPELAKISPLVTRPMKQQQPHHLDMAGPVSSSSSGRGRPKGSTNKSHGLQPPVTPIKTEESASVSASGGGGVGGGAGNQVWICPACGSVDDGSPMIGCDGCDNWYHWLCVGIHEAPDASEDWFCRVCIMQRKEMMSGDGLAFADLAARKKEKKKKKKEKRAMKMEAGSD